MTQVKKTFFGFKRILGRKFDDPHVQESSQLLIYNFKVYSKNWGITDIHRTYNDTTFQKIMFLYLKMYNYILGT